MKRIFRRGHAAAFSCVSEREEHEAELFYHDLLGVPRHFGRFDQEQLFQELDEGSWGLAGLSPSRRPFGPMVGESRNFTGTEEAESFFEELTGVSAQPPFVAYAAEDPEPLPPGFLRWSPDYRGDFPPRPAAATGGRAFMQTIAGNTSPRNWVAREDAIVRQLVTGNMPDALVRWVEITLPPVRRGRRTIQGSVKVLPDYLCIGSDGDFVYVPLDPVSAQKVAYELDAMLPTARVCHAVYLATSPGHRIGMISRDYYQPDSRRRTAPRGLTQESTAAYLEHSEAIRRKMREKGIHFGSLVAGHKKDVVISRALHANPKRIAFHGFYDAHGFPMEPCYENPTHRPQPGCQRDEPTLAHTRRFSDYSQGVRLMNKQMVVNGQERAVAEVLADPELSWLLSSEGPIVPPRIPTISSRRTSPSRREAENSDLNQTVASAPSYVVGEQNSYPAYSEQQAPTVQRPYLPTGGRNFISQSGTFNCSPTPYRVIPASFLPTPSGDPNAAIDAALTTAGLNTAQRRRVTRVGLIPIAREFGQQALTELLARLRWSAADIARPRWGNGADSMLVQRLLIHIPGHFRELARRAPNAGEAFLLECLGWLLMSTLRDSVAAATRRRWWIPPAPDFVTPVPNPIPAASTEVQRIFTRHLYIDTLMTAGAWNGRLLSWARGLAGRQWHAEVYGVRPGLPFYASLITVPAHVNTTAMRASFVTAWQQRLADTDAAHTPHGAAAATVTLAGLQNAVALRACDNANPHLPPGALSALDLQGLELAYEFPMTVGRRTVRRLPLMQQLHPVYTAVFRAIKELGWNDLLYQTSGAGCFRGIKHGATARVNIGGTSVLVNPFNRPNATTVTRINTLFTPAERARVIRAARTARRMSEHGLGAAIDVNVPENAQGAAGRTFGSMDPRITALLEAFNFRWGACFRTWDPHHFEYCRTACAPASVPTTPVPGAPPLDTPRGTMPSGVGPMIA